MDFENEEWLPVKDYEGLYEVSSLGKVKSLRSGKIMAGSFDKDGYIRVQLSNKTCKKVRVHRLVLQTFQPTEEDLLCDHKNQIKNDNRLENLQWATHSQNTRHQLKRKGTASRFIGVCKYRNRWRAQCTLNYKTIHIGTFDTEEDAAKAYNDFIIKHDLQDFAILNEIMVDIL